MATILRRAEFVPWVATVIAVFCIVVFPSIALAHAYIVKSSPSVNATMQSAPTKVQIWFDEPIQAVFNSLSVVNESGTRVDLNDAHIDTSNPDLLECDLKGHLGDGLFTVN